MKFLAILALLISCSQISQNREPASRSKNILIIGDSHMAGPFGMFLHQSVSTLVDSNTISYGHASSAPLHWLSETRYKLTGGVYHNLSAHKTINANTLVRMANPNPTDWRVAVEVPEFYPLVTNMNIHHEWERKGFPSSSPDYVVIELGANDRRAIFHHGSIDQREFERRKSFARDLALAATSNGAKCLWIGPPHGKNKTDEEQAAVYDMLAQGLADTDCKLISSNHYKAMGCDGIHFNCRDEMDNAKKWANEMAQLVIDMVND